VRRRDASRRVKKVEAAEHFRRTLVGVRDFAEPFREQWKLVRSRDLSNPLWWLTVILLLAVALLVLGVAATAVSDTMAGILLAGFLALFVLDLAVFFGTIALAVVLEARRALRRKR
jgi:hypothetical protein